MSLKVGQIVKHRNGKYSIVTSIDERNEDAFPVKTTYNGMSSYTRAGRYMTAEEHAQDLVRVIHLLDGCDILYKGKHHIFFNGRLHEFQDLSPNKKTVEYVLEVE